MKGISIGILTLAMLASPAFSDDGEVSLNFSIDDNERIWRVDASMRIQMTPVQFVTLLDRGPENCEWLFNCKEVILLNPPTDNVRVIATRLDSPWPFSDRIMYTKSTISYNSDQSHVLITITPLPADEIKALPNDAVMITNPSGQWQLSKIDEDYLLSYRGKADIDPSIPKFLLKRQVEKSTKATFENIRKLHE